MGIVTVYSVLLLRQRLPSFPSRPVRMDEEQFLRIVTVVEERGGPKTNSSNPKIASRSDVVVVAVRPLGRHRPDLSIFFDSRRPR